MIVSKKDAPGSYSLDINDSIKAHDLEPDDNIAHLVLNGDLHNKNNF
jgi:hypothetical protein